MPHFTAGTVITIPAGYGSSGRSGYRFDGGKITLSAGDAARLNQATGGNGRATRGGYSIPAEAFMDDAYFAALAEIAERAKENRRRIDANSGGRYMTPAEQAGYERWKTLTGPNWMPWAEYQREILNSNIHKPKPVAKGGVRTQAQAERLVQLLRLDNRVNAIAQTPVSAVNMPMKSPGIIDAHGPLTVTGGAVNSQRTVNLFWKSGKVFLYKQSFDFVGAADWNWYQCDAKAVEKLLKTGQLPG